MSLLLAQIPWNMVMIIFGIISVGVAGGLYGLGCLIGKIDDYLSEKECERYRERKSKELIN